ncbi:ribonuclease H-like domain-containing protein [Tanacetum coccineum]
MTGNIAHLSDFKDFDGGYVTFGGGAYGGRITGKDLLILLPDENQILLKIPRQDNMYSFDMKNIVPKDSLTCLVAKATSEESMLWHRRLGHINFKNINKLVKENLEVKQFQLLVCRIGFLIVKPHNKQTSFELFIAKLLGYTTLELESSGTNFDIGFLRDKHDRRNGPCTTRSFESSTSSQQDQDNQDCIVMPIWKDASYFGDAAPRSVADAQIQDKDGLQDENDATEKSHDDSSLKDNGTVVQQVNTARPKINTGPSHASEDTQVEDQEVELGNIPQSYAVPTTPHTRIHKDHPIEHVIGDVQSSVQTRRMTTSYSEQGFLSAIYEGKTHQDLHTCLFACFLSQEEPKRVSKALSGQISCMSLCMSMVSCFYKDISSISYKEFLDTLKANIFSIWYSKDSPLELVAYTDSDYAGATQDRKSTLESNSQLNDKSFVDSGCSRNMTGNITHLSYFKDFDEGMDKAKITRKPSKRANTDTGNGRAQKKPGNQAKVKKSTSGQPSHPHWSRQARECHVDVKKAQEKRDFTLLSLTEQTQTSQSRIATLAIRVRSFSDLTAQDDSPIIEKLYGHD